jgi:hypothetical protein
MALLDRAGPSQTLLRAQSALCLGLRWALRKGLVLLRDRERVVCDTFDLLRDTERACAVELRLMAGDA